MPDTIATFLRRRADNTPDQPAFRFHHQGDGDTVDWTYAQAQARAAVLARELAGRVAPGDRVILALEPGLHFVAALFAIFQVGATAVPSFPPYGSRATARFASIYRDCAPRLIVAEPRVQQLAGRIEDMLGTGPMRAGWMFIDSTDHTAFAGGPGEAYSGPDAGGAHPALLQYTSGSTGAPKGVVLTHANLLSNSACLEHVMAPLAPHLGFSWLPPYHDMGLMGALLLSVYSGFTLHMMSPAHFVQRPLRWLQAISEFGITSTVGPNFALDLCAGGIDDDELDGLDLSSLRLLFCGAEPVRCATLDRFAERFAPCGFDRRAFLPCYGMAEATLFVSGTASIAGGRAATELACDAPSLAEGRIVPAAADAPAPPARLAGCGQPAIGHDVAIVDPATGQRLGERSVGEVWVSGPNVAAGYFRNAAATEAAFAGAIAGAPAHAAYLRTGDLGALVNGELFVTGRIKEVINFLGRNLYPQDIETTVLGLHAGLRANGIAAFAVEEGGAERLVLVAELSRGSRLAQAGLAALERAIVEAVTTQHGVAPHAVLLVLPATIPLTTSGKIQRTACREQYLRGDFHQRLVAASARLAPAAGAQAEVTQ